MERMNDHRHLTPPPAPKGKVRKGKAPVDPQAKYRTRDRSPALWGQWLTDRAGGLQRQMLQFFGIRRGWGGHDAPTYAGKIRTPERAAEIRRNRAKAKAGRRQHVRQQMARRGKR